jgi:hypothetical protein
MQSEIVKSNSSGVLLTTPTSPPPASASADSTNGLRDIRPPVEVPGEWTWLLWTLLAIAVIALMGLLVRRWWRGRQRERCEAMIPPHVKAREQLRKALQIIHLPGPFCILVSNTIRIYLEERFNLRAPERTTEEFLGELQGSDRLTPAQKESLARFLEQCDLVKFARYEPAQNELEQLHAAALRLVDETEPRPAAEPALVGAGEGRAS